jgi:cardiolipin synthase (CMP-forming)
MSTIPNLISLARLCAVPVAIWLMIEGAFAAALWVMLAAGVSDAVDGYLAKRFNARTEFGAFLDPLADKALLVGTYVTLGHLTHLPVWLVVLVVFRDTMILAGAFVVQALTQSFKSRPIVISKINTGFQVALAIAVLIRLGLGIDLGILVEMLIWLTAATTVTSGFTYLSIWTRRLGAAEGKS